MGINLHGQMHGWIDRWMDAVIFLHISDTVTSTLSALTAFVNAFSLTTFSKKLCWESMCKPYEPNFRVESECRSLNGLS